MSSNKFVSIFDNLRTIKIKKQFNLKRTILKRNIDNKKCLTKRINPCIGEGEVLQKSPSVRNVKKNVEVNVIITIIINALQEVPEELDLQVLLDPQVREDPQDLLDLLDLLEIQDLL